MLYTVRSTLSSIGSQVCSKVIHVFYLRKAILSNNTALVKRSTPTIYGSFVIRNYNM